LNGLNLIYSYIDTAKLKSWPKLQTLILKVFLISCRVNAIIPIEVCDTSIKSFLDKIMDNVSFM